MAASATSPNRVLYFLGLQRIPASLSSVLLYIYPVFVALNMWVVEGRKPARLEMGAMALALVGATLTASPWDSLRGVGPDLLGVLLVLGAAAGYGVYIVVSNRYVHRSGPLISTAWVALGASVSFGLTGLVTRTWVVPATPRAAALLLGLIVFSTILPLATFFAGMRRVGPTAASLLSTLEPVFTIALAAVVLGEALHALSMDGWGIDPGGSRLAQSANAPSRSELNPLTPQPRDLRRLALVTFVS